MTSVSELINTINATADSPPEVSNDERSALIAACEKLKTKLESPMEMMMRTLFAPLQSVILRLATDMKLFDAAAELSADGKKFHLDDLVSKLPGVDKLLLLRVMRFLVAIKFFDEVAKETYSTTPLAAACVSDSILAHGIIHMTSQNEIMCKLPTYFEEKGYKNPGDAYDGPFQYALHTDNGCFDWLATQPRLQKSFNICMGVTRTMTGERWFEYLPIKSKLSGKPESEPLVVDVGGGIGHDLIALQKEVPSLTGRLIVQDIPAVIDDIKNLPMGVEAMRHDFFQPQPVKNATAYYLSNVLHDWPDKQALQILGHIRDAMGEGSILFIHENTLPEERVNAFSACTDWLMMAVFSSLERTEQQFRALLDEAGLELVHTWEPKAAAHGDGRRLLEAVLKRT
ncbi:hypothetical protein FQN50_003579 [Emmonsiellopsis sp. PD_5]|nr:hypothetical protein FQN50_003579 [Emmonsiellopsis sp. PD_5]